MTKTMFKTPYDGKDKSFKTAVVGESLTQQNFQPETDIQNIIRKHDRTGLISHVQRGIADYGDYSEINEYRESLDMVNAANESFGQLPSDIRASFQNDAGKFFEFATNPANQAELVQMGLAPPPKPEPPFEAEPVRNAPKEASAPATAQSVAEE